MTLATDHPLTQADKKSLSILGEKAVVKSLSKQIALHRLPRYVAEYMIAKYVKPETWRDNLASIESRIRDLLPEPSQRPLLKDKLLRNGEAGFIDLIEARVELRTGQRFATIPCLDDNRVRVSDSITAAHPGLLLGGLWGTAKVRYEPEKDENPNELIAFTPFQIGKPNLLEFKKLRSHFSTEEWIDLMLQSAGYNANAFIERRTKLLVLSRLIPLIERNVNLIELGPRQTGKTFLLRNVSPRVFTISGSRTSPANLFVNLNTKQLGIIGTRKVVVFDEIAHSTFDDPSTLSTLKDYMESGQFARGSMSFSSDAGIVLTGNIDVHSDQPSDGYYHLFQPLPSELIDSAFLDRIHAYIPGWEIPKISPSSIATGVGFVTDFYGEVLVLLRDESMAHHASEIPLHAGLTKRDLTAIERVTSGLLKLIYPDGRMTRDELHEIVSLACEYRQRVHNQLTVIAAGEFNPKLIAPSDVTTHTPVDLLPRLVNSENDRLNHMAVIGAATGLSVVYRDDQPVGGALIEIQVAGINGSPNIDVTGKHGYELEHSVRAVYNLIRSRFREFGISDSRLKSQFLAVHLVNITSYREGPSAGLAFFIGMVSALTGRPVKPGFAFSGEVALLGEVGAVGGLAHKLSAAVKAGRKEVIVPAANSTDIERLPQNIKDSLRIHSILNAAEAISIALEDR